MTDDVLREQIAYYRARAQEYDQSILGAGSGPAGAPPGDSALAALQAATLRALQPHAPFDSALELACGTGLWTQALLPLARHITAVDAAPEMLAIVRAKLGDAPVTYRQADLFAWAPDRQYDLVFFAFWLSHVPPARLDSFLTRAARAVRPGGHLCIVDQHAPSAADRQAALTDLYHRRPLQDGRTFTIVKVFYDPAALQAKLAPLGFQVASEQPDAIFFYLLARRAAPESG